MWWDFHRQIDLTPEQLVDEDDPIGMLEPVGPLDDEKKGKQTWRYSLPATGLRPRSWRGLRPGQQAGSAERLAVQLDRRRRSRGRCREADAWTSGGPLTSRIRAPSCRSTGSGPRTTRRRCIDARRVGRRQWDRRRRTVPRRRAICCSSSRRGSAKWLAKPLVAPGETDLEAARRLALALDHTTLAIQGPPGSGKTYSGARMI